MTHEEKINYMKIATGIVGYGFDPKGLDVLVFIYELVIKNEGSTDLKMVVQTEIAVEERATAKKEKELLDKKTKEKVN